MKNLLTLLLLFPFVAAMADLPGNHKSPDKPVSIANSKGVKGYTFYYKIDYSNASGKVKDKVYTIPGSNGTPARIYIWGVSKSNPKMNTDTTSFWGGENPTELRIDSVMGHHLVISEHPMPEKLQPKKKENGALFLPGSETGGFILLAGIALSSLSILLLVMRRKRLALARVS